ncbi:MAG TPA: response regulator [Terriglobales bacterium]|nr:response regulator [Terriglobales bacterium]
MALLIVSRQHPELLRRFAEGFNAVGALDVIADRREQTHERPGDRRQWSIQESLRAYGWALVRDGGARATDPPPEGGPRVLVVDDHADTRDLTELVLRDAGYDVRQAEDGVDALEVIRAWTPQVVITDIFMRGMDGVELIREIRRGKRDIRILAISAGWRAPRGADDAGGPDVLEDARAAGADLTSLKPLDARELLKSVAELLGERAG